MLPVAFVSQIKLRKHELQYPLCFRKYCEVCHQPEIDTTNDLCLKTDATRALTYISDIALCYRSERLKYSFASFCFIKDTFFGTMYTSDDRGILFSKSLERHLFDGQRKSDFTNITSLRGVYLTNKLDDGTACSLWDLSSNLCVYPQCTCIELMLLFCSQSPIYNWKLQWDLNFPILHFALLQQC